MNPGKSVNVKHTESFNPASVTMTQQATAVNGAVRRGGGLKLLQEMLQGRNNDR